MTRIINTKYKPHRELGETDADWEALKTKVRDFLQTNGNKSVLEIADIRAVDPKLRNNKVWEQVRSDLLLIEIP